MRIGKSVRLRELSIVVLGTLLLGLVSACFLFNDQAPVARIVASVLSGNSPLTVTFTATTVNDPDVAIISYEWDFGDGVTDTGPTVQHTFVTVDAVKVFEVTLIITDANGATSQATQTIEVHLGEGVDPPTGPGIPTARFTASAFIGVDPLTVIFDATGSTTKEGTIIAYNWDFGDNGTDTGANVTHTYMPNPEVTTTYVATLFVWNSNNQVDAEQLNIIVIVPENDTGDEEPVADVFVTGPDIIYESVARPDIPSLFEVKLDPRGSYADAGHVIEYFAWDFGDGDLHVETSDLEITHIYELSTPARTYVASLTVFDDQGLHNTILINITLSQD
jgi:PKD repeat protein